MLNLKTLTSILLLITTPTFLIYPQEKIPHNSFQLAKVKNSKKKSNKGGETSFAISKAITYDEILNLLDKIESGSLDMSILPADISNINHFLALLAQQGVTSHRSAYLALEDDINDLLDVENDLNEYAYYLDDETDFILIPGIFNEQQDILLCKSWAKRQWKKTKKFVKNHKKEIIIGAAIVVASVVVVTAVAAASVGAAAATAAGASAASLSGSNKENKSSPPSDTESPSISSMPGSTTSVLEASEHAPLLRAYLDQHTAPFKKLMIEDMLDRQLEPSKGWDDLSFCEKARECGAYLAHQALKDISELASVAPDLFQEIKNVGAYLLPEGLIAPNNGFIGSPIENYENFIIKGHHAIDGTFSTDQSEMFIEDGRLYGNMNNFTLGFIPLPGMISSCGSINVRGFSDLGKIADRAGLTKAGRGVMKHGNREGRTVFPKPSGNPSQVNLQGQERLEKILNHPDKIIKQYVNNRYGPVIEIEAPELGGVRFTGDGKEMMGFLEPFWLKK